MNPKLTALMAAANFDPSKERKDMTLERLSKEIEEGNIVLPIFQTYIRWTKAKAVDLFNYQLNGKAPVAPISINLIDDPSQVIEQISFLDRKILDSNSLVGKLSVADGQQRLSTNFKAYSNHEDFKSIVLDLKKGIFIQLADGAEIEKHQIPVGILYNKEHSIFLTYVNSNSYLKKDEVKDVLSSIRKKHQQYYYVVNFATNLSREEQMKWFEVLNLAGSQVTEAMVYLTELLVKGTDFYTEYANPFGELLDSYGLGDLFPRKSAEISIPLATLNPAFFKITGKEKTHNSSPIPSDVKPKSIGKLDVSEIQKMIKITLNALENVLTFINTDPEIKTPDRIDILTYLVGLFVEKEITLPVSTSQKEFLKNWINEVDFVNNSNKVRRTKYEKLIIDYPTAELASMK